MHDADALIAHHAVPGAGDIRAVVFAGLRSRRIGATAELKRCFGVEPGDAERHGIARRGLPIDAAKIAVVTGLALLGEASTGDERWLGDTVKGWFSFLYEKK